MPSTIGLVLKQFIFLLLLVIHFPFTEAGNRFARRQWEMRFFRLDPFLGRLEYYVDKGKEQRGSVRLADVTVVTHLSPIDGRQVREGLRGGGGRRER